MTEIVCQSCGCFFTVGETVKQGERLTAHCPSCGAVTIYRIGSPTATTRIVDGAAATRRMPRPAAPADEASVPAPVDPSRTTLIPSQGAAPPPLPSAAGGYFLILGAEPGRERIPLRTARTVFGRAEADVDLGDATVSSRHFQVEVAGREFFIRDLKSRNGTFVNGRRIHYAELLPGDEVLAGSTYLVFRTSKDRLGKGDSRGG